MNKKDFWIGVGVGAGVGLAGGFIIGNQMQKRKARREFKRVRQEAYYRGAKDAGEETEAIRSELNALKEMVVIVDPTDDQETIRKKIQDHYDKFEPQEAENQPEKHENPAKTAPSEGISGDFEGKNAANEARKAANEAIQQIQETAKSDEGYGEKESTPTQMRYPFTVSGNNVIFYGAAGTELKYPRWLVMNKRGELLDEMEIRSNIQSYETDQRKLMVIWNTMGWGTYMPQSYTPSIRDEDIFDDESKEYGDEPEEKTREREKYLDEVERYISHPEEGARVISNEDFNDENYLDKLYFDYFDVDNVFIENSDTGEPVDAFTLFGTNDGQELFRHKIITDDDDDPDVIHLKNFGANCVMEITRFHKSYKSLQDGSAYVNGGST